MLHVRSIRSKNWPVAFAMERPVAANSRRNVLPVVRLAGNLLAALAEQRLRALIVRDGEQPVGILPLVVLTESTGVGRVRTLTYPLHDWGTFYGPIGPNPTATLIAGMRHIQRTPRDWDMMDLRWVDLDGCDRGRTERTMEQVGFRPCKKAWDVAPQIEYKAPGKNTGAAGTMAAQCRALRPPFGRTRRSDVCALPARRLR